jgi:hypothetical protein
MKKQSKGRMILAMLNKGMTTAQIVQKTKAKPAYVYTIKSLNKGKKKEALAKALLANGNSPKNVAEVTGIHDPRMPDFSEKDIPTPLEDFAMRVDGESSSPDETQVGGDHYKDNKIQVWDAIHDWGLGYFSGNVIKYVARHKKKNGVEDLKKARHYLDKLISIVE